MNEIVAVEYHDGRVRLLDQRALPGEELYLECASVSDLAESIRNLTVRGAPAIGIAAAYGMAMAARNAKGDPFSDLEEAALLIGSTRPTAVNLFWAIERMMKRAKECKGLGTTALVRALEEEACAIHQEDVLMNRAIGQHGAPLIKEGHGVLTHCNAGALATGGIGTALGVLKTAHEGGVRFTAYMTETRPVLQGARLTAWEIMKAGIPGFLITDGMAAHFMAKGEINLVIVGADRIASNGDVANKIGTFNLAVLAKAHGVPFYVAAPRSTLDLSLKSGGDIMIEERDPDEVKVLCGQPIAPPEIAARNPAFDVTPSPYITGIITDRGILKAPYDESLKNLSGTGGIGCAGHEVRQAES